MLKMLSSKLYVKISIDKKCYLDKSHTRNIAIMSGHLSLTFTRVSTEQYDHYSDSRKKNAYLFAFKYVNINTAVQKTNIGS